MWWAWRAYTTLSSVMAALARLQLDTACKDCNPNLS